MNDDIEIKAVSTAVMDSETFKRIMDDISRASLEEIAEAVKYVERNAPPYYIHPADTSFVATLDDLIDAGYAFVDERGGVVTLRAPHTVRAFWLTQTIKP
jgi:hypothetical protein